MKLKAALTLSFSFAKCVLKTIERRAHELDSFLTGTGLDVLGVRSDVRDRGQDQEMNGPIKGRSDNFGRCQEIIYLQELSNPQEVWDGGEDQARVTTTPKRCVLHSTHSGPHWIECSDGNQLLVSISDSSVYDTAEAFPNRT